MCIHIHTDYIYKHQSNKTETHLWAQRGKLFNTSADWIVFDFIYLFIFALPALNSRWFRVCLQQRAKAYAGNSGAANSLSFDAFGWHDLRICHACWWKNLSLLAYLGLRSKWAAYSLQELPLFTEHLCTESSVRGT